MTRPVAATRNILRSMQKYRCEHAARPVSHLGTPMVAVPMKNLYRTKRVWQFYWWPRREYGRWFWGLQRYDSITIERVAA